MPLINAELPCNNHVKITLPSGKVAVFTRGDLQRQLTQEEQDEVIIKNLGVFVRQELSRNPGQSWSAIRGLLNAQDFKV